MAVWLMMLSKKREEKMNVGISNQFHIPGKVDTPTNYHPINDLIG
jgi:hypothetical protein